MKSKVNALVACLGWLAFVGCAARCPLKGNEQVSFFQNYAYPSADNKQWRVPISGWVYEPKGDNSRPLTLLRLIMRVPGKEEQTVNFEERARWFFVDNKKGKQLPVAVGDKKIRLTKSDDTGHFNQEVSLPASALSSNGQSEWATYHLTGCEKEDRDISGQVQLVPSEGLSIVSDIDQTLFEKSDADLPVLSSIFYQPLNAVVGMPAVFRRWKDSGALFHYFSADPWQLYPVLNQFLQNQGFPKGSLELKPVRWQGRSLASGTGLLDAFTDLFDTPVTFKNDSVEKMLQRFPRRKFILIGSSDGQDPEIFGSLARKYPQQVQRVLIHRVGSETDSKRFEKAFENIPAAQWQVFDKPEEIKS